MEHSLTNICKKTNKNFFAVFLSCTYVFVNVHIYTLLKLCCKVYLLGLDVQVIFSICIHWSRKIGAIFTRNMEFSICWTFFACSLGTATCESLLPDKKNTKKIRDAYTTHYAFCCQLTEIVTVLNDLSELYSVSFC